MPKAFNKHDYLQQGGVYIITPSNPDTTQLCQQVRQAIQAGARLVQYREKTLDKVSCETQARALLTICQHYCVPLLINDDIHLAAKIGADGAHIGIEDGSLTEARAILGEHAIIGVSCYANLALAEQMAHAGADYIALGAMFASSTKPQAKTGALQCLSQANELPCPIVAIGGITHHNAHQLKQAGADWLAVIHAVFGAENIPAAVQGLFP